MKVKFWEKRILIWNNKILSFAAVTTLFCYAGMEIAIAQVYELRDTAVPAKTVDQSGEKINEDPLAGPPPSTVLSGSLTREELQGRVSVNNDGKSLTLYLVNRGKRALIFEGDRVAVKTEDQKEEEVLSQNEAMKPPDKVQVPNDVKNVAISILSLGAFPAGYDIATQYQPDGTPFYGKDQERRKLAERRFGKRTLFPGEATTGKVFLHESVTLPSQLSIPVIVHPSGESLGNIVLPINPQP